MGAPRAVSPGDRDDCGLIEGEVRRLARELVLAGARVVGEGTLADAEDLVADLEPGYICAGCHDRAGDVEHGNGVLECAQAVAHEANQAWLAHHEAPSTPVDPGGVDSNQYLVVSDRCRSISSRRSTSTEPHSVCTIAWIVCHRTAGDAVSWPFSTGVAVRRVVPFVAFTVLPLCRSHGGGGVACPPPAR